jgi:hypothetical protein
VSGVRRLIAGLVCGACAALPASASAAGSHARDVQATRAYLHAYETYVPEVELEVGAQVAAIEMRESEVAAQCPSALTYAPRDAAFEEVSEELATAQWYAGVAPIRSIMLRLAGVIAHLSWSDHELTRLVHAEATEELAEVALVLPDVCAQIEAWKASGYASLPSGVSEFLANIEVMEAESTVGRSEESRERLIMHLLRGYETPAERRLVRGLERREERSLKRREAGAIAARSKLVAALGGSEL